MPKSKGYGAKHMGKGVSRQVGNSHGSRGKKSHRSNVRYGQMGAEAPIGHKEPPGHMHHKEAGSGRTRRNSGKVRPGY